MAQHTAQGAEFFQDHHYAEAEAEYRAAIKLDPQNSDLHMALSRALNSQKRTDEGMKEAHLAIRLNPESDMAHFALGNALRMQEDWTGAAAEYREAIRLNPNYDMTHNNLGVTLRRQDNVDGAIEEYRKALQLNPEANNWPWGTLAMRWSARVIWMAPLPSISNYRASNPSCQDRTSGLVNCWRKRANRARR